MSWLIFSNKLINGQYSQQEWWWSLELHGGAIDVQFCWVPAHEGLQGAESADQSSPAPLGEVLKKKEMEVWQRRWDEDREHWSMCVLVYLRNWEFIVGPLDGMWVWWRYWELKEMKRDTLDIRSSSLRRSCVQFLRILTCRHMCIICGDLVSNIAVMVVEGGLPGVFTLECKQSRGFYQELHHLTFCQESTHKALSVTFRIYSLPDPVWRAGTWAHDTVTGTMGRTGASVRPSLASPIRCLFLLLVLLL